MMMGRFTQDCDCYLSLIRAADHSIEKYATDNEAVSAGYQYWAKLIRSIQSGNDQLRHHYWSIHGPSGHLISLKDTPYRNLPPLPPPCPKSVLDKYESDLADGTIVRLQSMIYAPTEDKR